MPHQQLQNNYDTKTANISLKTAAKFKNLRMIIRNLHTLMKQSQGD